MGKKYIPIELQCVQYRVYLENLHKIYKVVKKQLPAVPKYSRRISSRKESLETVPDTLPYFEESQVSLWIGNSFN